MHRRVKHQIAKLLLLLQIFAGRCYGSKSLRRAGLRPRLHFTLSVNRWAKNGYGMCCTKRTTTSILLLPHPTIHRHQNHARDPGIRSQRPAREGSAFLHAIRTLGTSRSRRRHAAAQEARTSPRSRQASKARARAPLRIAGCQSITSHDCGPVCAGTLLPVF